MNIVGIIAPRECPYWDYTKHTRTHDCSSCNCCIDGNNIENVKYGIMVDKDRYCMLEADVSALKLSTLKEDIIQWLTKRRDANYIGTQYGLARYETFDECLHNFKEVIEKLEVHCDE